MAQDDQTALKLTREGMQRAREGDLRAAIRCYDRAIQAADHLPALENRACAYYHLGDFDLAVRDSTWALEVDDARAPMWLLRGLARSRLGDDAARDDLRRYLSFDVKTARFRSMAKRALRDLRRRTQGPAPVTPINPFRDAS